MFLNNKYTNWYTSLIANAMSRDLDKSVYVERHHIIPKCMGGPDTPENLAKLTAKEHFIAHLLLTKMADGVYQRKMIFALWRMTQDNQTRKSRHQVTASVYQWIKENMAQDMSLQNKGRRPTEQERINQLNGIAKKGGVWNKGKKMPPEFAKKVSQSRKGSKSSEETKRKISASIKQWNAKRGSTENQLGGRKIPRFTTIIRHKQTREEFITTHQTEWLRERGLGRHALERGTCDYVVIRRYVTRTGEEVPIKKPKIK